MVLIISVVVSLIWIRILKSFDDAREFKSKRTAVSGFFLCGLLSVPLVLMLYWVVGPMLYPITRESLVLEELFLVGPVEELGKFLVFYVVAAGSNSIQEPRDGVLHAASVGLAFAVVENFYYSVYGIDVLLYRSVMAAAGHMSYAAIWGYAAGVYLYTRPGPGLISDSWSPERWSERQTAAAGDGTAYGGWIVVSALTLAAFCHALYNSLLDLGLPGAATMLDAGTLFIALASLKYLKKVSPFTNIPFSQYRVAIPQLQEALRRNPQNFVLNKRIGLHYLRSRDTEKGRRHLKRASLAKPQELSTRFYLFLLEYLKAAEWKRTIEWRTQDGGAIVGRLNGFQGRAGGGSESGMRGTGWGGFEDRSSKGTMGPAGEALEEARQAVFQIALQMPLKSLRQLRRQVKQVFVVHPQRRQLFDLCDEIIDKKIDHTRGKVPSTHSTGTSCKEGEGLIRRYWSYKKKPHVWAASSRVRNAGLSGRKEDMQVFFPEPPLAEVDPELAEKKSRALGRIIENKRREFESEFERKFERKFE